MDRDNTIARLENIAKHAVHTAGEDTFILSLDDGLAIHEAIEALKAQLTHESTTSDLISRQAAIDAIDEERKQRHLFNTAEDGLLEARRIINTLTPVQPEPHEGYWIWVAGDLECSKCHTRYPDLYPDCDNSVACPHCGAHMKGERQK